MPAGSEVRIVHASDDKGDKKAPQHALHYATESSSELPQTDVKFEGVKAVKGEPETAVVGREKRANHKYSHDRFNPVPVFAVVTVAIFQVR